MYGTQDINERWEAPGTRGLVGEGKSAIARALTVAILRERDGWIMKVG